MLSNKILGALLPDGQTGKKPEAVPTKLDSTPPVSSSNDSSSKTDGRIVVKLDGTKFYRVQVGAFTEEANAQRLETKMKNQGLPALTLSGNPSRVISGLFPDLSSAEMVARLLKEKGYNCYVNEAMGENAAIKASGESAYDATLKNVLQAAASTIVDGSKSIGMLCANRGTDAASILAQTERTVTAAQNELKKAKHSQDFASMNAELNTILEKGSAFISKASSVAKNSVISQDALLGLVGDHLEIYARIQKLGQ